MVSLKKIGKAGSLALAGLLIASGCGEKKSPEPDKPAPSGSATATPVSTAGRVIVDLVNQIPSCDLEHRGLLLDAGSSAMTGRFAWSASTPEGTTDVEHDGSTWMRISARQVKLFFVWPESQRLFVAARSMGGVSKAAAVSLDDQPLGTLNFQRDQIRVATTNATTLPVDAGLHTLTIRLMGRQPQRRDPFVDLDWIRIGVPDESSATYGPPTMRDVVAKAAALSGVPHRSIALRGPGSVRCTLRFPPGSRLRTAVGLLGPGEADAQVRLLRDGEKPVDLGTQHVVGGEKATWTELSLPLDAMAGKLATVELRAEGTPVGSRVLFGDPAVFVPTVPPPMTPKARAVVIVALSGVSREELPPWHGGPTPHLPTLSDLALTATTFHQHRAPTTYSGGVMGSLLTALPPRAHALTDLGARMPLGTTLLGAVAHDASLRAAMFTGVPSTFKAYGFASGWERYSEYPPFSNDPATAPLDQAAQWVTDVLRQAPDARLLMVVHGRGAHPPWDVSLKEQAQLPPQNYTGVVETRRGAQQMAHARKRRDRKDPVFSPDDLQRAKALASAALSQEDRSLGALVAALKTAGIWESTVFVVAGEVSSSVDSFYGEGEDLAESRLALPLYVRFPDGRYAGAQVNLPTEIWDVTQTALSALGISFSSRGLGRDLSAIASGLEDSSADPQIATLDDRYSVRWGDLIMTGRYDSAPFLCDLSVDPTCAFNRRETMPLAAQALFRRMMEQDAKTHGGGTKREPVTLDQDTAAAMRVWGAME